MSTPDQFKNQALALAAQAWCTPETSGLVVDYRLVEAFADQLAGWMANYEGLMSDLQRANATIVDLQVRLAEYEEDDLK